MPVDFIVVEGDKIRSVQGYFDQKTLVEQLGLQVLVQPCAIGPVSFGSSTYLQLGRLTKPNAFSLGWIQLRSDEEEQQVREYGLRILQEVAQMPGFISTLIARSGHRFFAITAWEDAESPRQLRRGGTHREAMERFFGSDFAAAGHTSVWVPHQSNPLWVRCTACGHVVDYSQLEGKCQCGQPLPAHPPYW
jgi:heme-degrading monooxygenase HmoA